MKTRRYPLSKVFTLLIPIFLLGSLFMACKGTCVQQWKECYYACPTEEEGDQAIRDCIANCPPNNFQCVKACYDLSREACVDQCGDELQECLDEQ